VAISKLLATEFHCPPEILMELYMQVKSIGMVIKAMYQFLTLHESTVL
jgi:hypothetical protein